jgi:hypothetical protein
MPNEDDLQLVRRLLDECRSTLERLDAQCCEPGRSPRMAAIAGTIDRAEERVRTIGEDPTSASAAVAELEDAGAQIGALQIGCCAPNRLPLYAEILEELTKAQQGVSRSVGIGH